MLSFQLAALDALDDVVVRLRYFPWWSASEVSQLSNADFGNLSTTTTKTTTRNTQDPCADVVVVGSKQPAMKTRLPFALKWYVLCLVLTSVLATQVLKLSPVDTHYDQCVSDFKSESLNRNGFHK